MGDQYIKWLSDLNKKSGQTAGGKGANLGEMFNVKLPIPPAFVITTSAYNAFIEKTKIKEKIGELLDSINVDDTSDLDTKAKQIRELIINSEMPEDIKSEIEEAYDHLSVDKDALKNARGNALSILKNSQEPTFVAVRSSATTEDLDDASFAGQQESYLNIKGNSDLILTTKKVLASLFTSRAIYYRKKKGFSKEKFSLAVVVQKMINSDKSGVMFSKNPVRNDDSILIEAVYGLGEGIVSGKINPDSYEVSSELKIIKKNIGNKKSAIIRSASGETKEVKLTEERATSQVLTEGELTSLGNLAQKIEEHYGKPQDIEFAIEDREIFITQSRPITTVSKEATAEIKGEAILSGLGASPGVGAGKVRIINTMEDLQKVQKGDILVTKMTNPDMVVSMQKADGIITNEGGITSHAAIVSREMGIPAVVGTGNATEVLKDGDPITVDGSNGKIYRGETEHESKVEILPVVPTKKVKIKVIVDLPGATERAALTKCEAIGLTRLEGIIASSKKHPNWYIKNGNWEEYIETIEKGIEAISKPFKEIWIRTSDTRTDEYPSLEGAPPEDEANPMMGDHAIRFHLKHPELFKAELTAIKNVSKKYPDKKFGFMIPLVISEEEVIKAKEIAKEIGMENVKVGIMVETPAACLIIKNLLKLGIDFISFGTNDLTQFTLAIDRNNDNVQHLFNEEHPAVLNEIKRVLRTCQELGVESSICGQAGSRKGMAKFLVENGINSISVNADAAHDISKLVAELEGDSEEPQEDSTEKDNSTSTPEQKTKEVIQKIEGAIVKEIIEHPKEILNPGNPTPNPSKPIPLPGTTPEEKTPDYIQGGKPKVPTYVAGIIEQNREIIDNNLPEIIDKDQEALDALFAPAPFQKMESEENPEDKHEPPQPEPIEKEIEDEEDEVVDIF